MDWTTVITGMFSTIGNIFAGTVTQSNKSEDARAQKAEYRAYMYDKFFDMKTTNSNALFFVFVFLLIAAIMFIYLKRHNYIK